jgi:hypothetical protein
MPDIPIHNETDYSLTGMILDQIKRDAVEYFGESVRAIRIQYGIDRHAFNARTGEMRYAFSPGDFGLVDETASFPEPYYVRDIPSIDDEAEDDIDDAVYDEVDVDENEEEEEEPSLASLTEELDTPDDEEASGFEELEEEEFEEFEDDDKEFLYDDDEDY